LEIIAGISYTRPGRTRQIEHPFHGGPDGVAIRSGNSRHASVGKGFLLFVAVFWAVGSCRAVPADFRVWVANDSVRIDPRGGKAYEDNPFLFPDALTGDYQSSSLIWNGARRTVTLKAARNESVSFQIIIDRLTDKPLSHVGSRSETWSDRMVPAYPGNRWSCSRSGMRR